MIACTDSSWRWERAQSVQAFVDEYRAAIGQVAPDGDLATWLEWLGRRAVAIDPVRRLSPGRILTLYHPAYSFNADRILEEGFSDTTRGPGQRRTILQASFSPTASRPATTRH